MYERVSGVAIPYELGLKGVTNLDLPNLARFSLIILLYLCSSVDLEFSKSLF